MRKPPPANPLAIGRTTLPDMTDPCAMLADARAKYYLLMTGGATQVIETPMLGRVEFTPASVDQMGRFVQALADECARASGDRRPRRRPYSVEACP